ncbi:MAG: AAA family ATPase [Gammaproteobacteria bacterium]|nr:AAA family ATPase [Gammaproteobacteria bacterium]
MHKNIRRRRYKSGTHPMFGDYQQIIHYWILQTLVPLGAHKSIILERHCTEDAVLQELGLSHMIEAKEFNANEARLAVQKLHSQIDTASPAKFPKHTQLAMNIQWLGKVIGLNDVEQSILHLRVIASRHITLRACLVNVGQAVDLLYAADIFAKLLDVDTAEVELAFKPGGRLIRTGLISIPTRLNDVMDKICLLPGLADNLFTRNDDSYAMFRENFAPASMAKLTTDDYPHLKEDISLLKSYLGDALEQKREGVNVLIYGTPGSGKTEFVKMLAQEISHPLFEIATEDSDGEPIRRANRFRSFRLSQHILASNTAKPLVLFDEVEDVFSINDDDDDEQKGNGRGMKGWINKLLEGNKVPSFWLSNNLHCLDNAFIRRFDYVIELNSPPRSVRSKVLDQYLGEMDVSQAWKTNMAEHEYLNPAVVERAAKVIEAAKNKHPGLHSEKALERILGNTLEALGLSRAPKNTLQCVTDYRLDILNTDCNLGEVCEGLREHGEGRLCLYGAPGTGKSAFGRYLADKLDRPLMVRRASDILSPYIGVAEKNMAKMFRNASEENAVLLLDEADTFLRDRNGAVRSWEVSEVNEMLTQMESFTGIFIASTNLMDSLDSAALRRFDMKVKFDYLKTAQAWQLFIDAAAKLNFEPSDIDRAALDKLCILTPGDFANVMRQSRLRKIHSAGGLIERLSAECKVKPEGMKQAIGF